MCQDRQRLDKWLWFARIVRTRSLAAALVATGRIRVNRARILKPGHDVGPGDILTVSVAGQVRVLKLIGLAERRGPASDARRLYEDLSAAQCGHAAAQKHAAEQ